MGFHRTAGQMSMADRLFNKKLRWGQCVVENAFGILKQTFRELLTKSDLIVAFLPDVILACAILHNVLLGQSHNNVENLLQVLQTEGLDGEAIDDVPGFDDGGEGMPEMVAAERAAEKRNELGLYLSMQRQLRQ